MKAVNRTHGNNASEAGINSLSVINHQVKKQKQRGVYGQGISKLPSIYVPSLHVPRSARPKAQLTDFLEDLSGAFRGEPSAEAYFKVNILARDKAIQILQQYNEIVADDNSLAVKNLPPVKVSIRAGGSKANFKNEKAKRLPVFTEGISSISKRPDPSFSVPKDAVIRSNLPKSVVVAQEKNKFTFGVRAKESKKQKDSNDSTPRYRQLRMLGLDKLPAVEVGRYMTKEQMMKASIQYRNRVKGNNLKSNGRNSRTDGKKRQLDKATNGQLTNRSRASGTNDFDFDPNRPDSKVNVVSIGDTLGPKYYENSKKMIKNSYPLYDWKQQQQEELKKLTFQSRNPSMYGICSLAPIRVAGQLNKIRTLEPMLDQFEQTNKPLKGTRKMKKKSRSNSSNEIGPWYNDMVNYVREFHQTSDDAIRYGSGMGDVLFDDHTDSYNRELRYRKPIPSPTESNSTCTTHTNMPNPPPSYVSSTEDDASRQIDNPRAMLQIQEEKSGFDLDTKEVPEDTFPDHDPESVSVTRSNSVARKTLVDGRRSKRSVLKEAKFGSIVNIGMNGPESESGVSHIEDGFYLSVPNVFVGERRPPVRDDRSEVSESLSRMHMDSQATWHSTRSEMIEPQRVTVTTLKLFNDENTVSPPFVTPVISVTPDTNDDNANQASGAGEKNQNSDKIERELTEEEFKRLTLNNKTLQFISPVHVLDNAKRQ